MKIKNIKRILEGHDLRQIFEARGSSCKLFIKGPGLCRKGLSNEDAVAAGLSHGWEARDACAWEDDPKADSECPIFE